MRLAIKIDVDTDRGTRIGVANLLNLFKKHNIQTTFLFSLGPDNTGRALKRVFRPGFLKKVSRTSVIQVYGLKTLLNGILWPGPKIGKRNKEIMRCTAAEGHEVGIHCYDHIRWQDGLCKMTLAETIAEVNKAQEAFVDVFGFSAKTAGAAGWQANAHSLEAYDLAGFDYGSDCRGSSPFIPIVDGKIFKTPQLPTTLPTLDELLGRPEYPLEGMTDFYLNQLKPESMNILTIHAELEGMAYLDWFDNFIKTALAKGVQFVPTRTFAEELLQNRPAIPHCHLHQGEVDGRSGLQAIQGELSQ